MPLNRAVWEVMGANPIRTLICVQKCLANRSANIFHARHTGAVFWKTLQHPALDLDALVNAPSCEKEEGAPMHKSQELGWLLHGVARGRELILTFIGSF